MSSILCKKILPFFSVVCLICIAFNVDGEAITISPSSITVGMAGGDVLTRDITFSHDGSSDMTCVISFEILPEGEGINISFSVGDSFVLKPGDTVINITINVSDYIMPGIYTINIYADAEGDAPDNGESGSKTYGGGSTIIIPDPVDDSPADEKPSDPVDETLDDTLLLDDTPPESDPQPSWVHRYYIPIILIALIITIIITLLILYGIERRKKENEK